MLIQIVALRNIVESDPSPTPDYVSHIVVKETPLCSFVESVCPMPGDQITVDGKNYVVVTPRDFAFETNPPHGSHGLSVKIRCYPRNRA